MIYARQIKAVVPVGPRALVELTCFSVRQDFAKCLIANLRDKGLNVSVVADVHGLSNHMLRHDYSFFQCFFHQMYLLANGLNDSWLIRIMMASLQRTFTILDK